MKLIFEQSGEEAHVGDQIIDDNGKLLKILRADMPHKPSSSGIVIVQEDYCQRECYAGVFGLKWIEREDQGWIDPKIAHAKLIGYASTVTGYTEKYLIQSMNPIEFLTLVKSIPLVEFINHPTEVRYLVEWLRGEHQNGS